MWWHTPFIPKLGRQRQPDHCEFKATLAYNEFQASQARIYSETLSGGGGETRTQALYWNFTILPVLQMWPWAWLYIKSRLLIGHAYTFNLFCSIFLCSSHCILQGFFCSFAKFLSLAAEYYLSNFQSHLTDESWVASGLRPNAYSADPSYFSSCTRGMIPELIFRVEVWSP